MTGFFLSFEYAARSGYRLTAALSTERNLGYLLRLCHSNGASLFFILIYLHLYRGIAVSSRLSFLWLSGWIILILLFATAFFGYSLPVSQISYWAATVITGLLGVVREVAIN